MEIVIFTWELILIFHKRWVDYLYGKLLLYYCWRFSGEFGKAKTPAVFHSFDINNKSLRLYQKKADIFHQFVARILWGSVQVHSNFLTVLSFLTTCTRKLYEDDWKKLTRMIAYIHLTIELKQGLIIDDMNIIK